MCVAFLRGINLGRRRVKNDELCAHFEATGFERVSAFLASGNILFESGRMSASKLESRIEQGLEERLRYRVPTFARSPPRSPRSPRRSHFRTPQLALRRGIYRSPFFRLARRSRTAALR